jgi:putative iron-dependent peroxidase
VTPAEPQAVLVPPTTAAMFLVATIGRGGEDVVRELLADVGGLRRSVGFRVPEAGLTCVVGIGAEAWDRLLGLPRPPGLHPFRELHGPVHHAVATPGDLLFHIRADRFDLCFELGQRITERLAGHATIIDEVHGFRSFDERDLLGFVDGTENPEGAAARSAVFADAGEPVPEGAGFVMVQRYLHDLAAWDALSVEAQERVIGRTKLSDLELDDDVKPADSHVALTTIVDETGEEQQILRFNMPFGRVGAGEFGTYFVGYARDPAVLETMLSNMFIGRPPGNYDRILDFSRAVTGNLFYVPPLEVLEDPPPPGPAAVAEPDEPAAAHPDSLGIGSLRQTGA